MAGGRGPTLSVRARGHLACFTRPELKVERMSYPVMTPSAARGILEAILWKPAIQWRVERILVMNEIRFIAFRRNEVSSKAAAPPATVVTNGGHSPGYFADQDRAQRNTVALRDVDYVIEAHFTTTDRAGPEENVTKFVAMFNRRVEKGQHFHQPYLGCREFVAEIGPVAGLPKPISETRDLGLMLWDIDYQHKQKRAIFFSARIEEGVLEVPRNPEADVAASAAQGAAQ